MRYIPVNIPEILLIEPQIFTDERGFFMEVYQADSFAKAGINKDFVQDNQSGSKQGTLRGLHYQIRHPQAKLVRVIAGEVYDVAVDLRRSSASFGKWVGVTLSAQNHHQLWIPIGFAHGIYILSDWAEILYKVSDYYAPEWERTLLWNDPEVGIQWPILDGCETILSEKDAHGTPLKHAELFD
jgi:dTDP-4-dehydrorhamnose 3,5-epimerase